MCASATRVYYYKAFTITNDHLQLLRSVNTTNDNKKKREAIRKVIAYMTLGIDVSKLFADMILACNTKDLVIKKMVYLYLCTYAQTNAELTLLAINTLQKDWYVFVRCLV
jgi:AP-4 complex subunit beta-1